MPHCKRLALMVLLILPALAAGEAPSVLKKLPPPDVKAILGGGTPDALAGSLRGYLVDNLPPLLFEDSRSWGKTKRVRVTRWRGKGLQVRREKVYVEKNDGTWRKVRATAADLADTLVLDIRNFRQPEGRPLKFDVFLAFDLRLYYDQQNWRSGLRLYSGSARGRLRVKLLAKCELSARLEDNGSLLPDVVARLRVTKASLSYDNLVVEHIAGVGGELAQMIGDAVKGGLREWHPSLERELLAKANAAIVKAGDSKEVRLSVGKLLGKKPAKNPAPP